MNKLSFWISALGWGSSVALLWLGIERQVAVDFLFWFAWAWFVLLGFGGGVMARAPG